MLLLVAFTVVAGTLFLQGLSLPWLARRLRVPSPDPLADALARANLLQQASQAGFAALDELDDDDPYGVRAQIEDRLERRNFSAWESLGAGDDETPSEAYARLRREMIDAERKHVLEIRSTGTVAHEVVRQVLALLDVEESMLEYSDRERAAVRAATPAVASKVTASTCARSRSRSSRTRPASARPASPRAWSGCTCGCASAAATSAAATPRPVATPAPTTARPDTR